MAMLAICMQDVLTDASEMGVRRSAARIADAIFDKEAKWLKRGQCRRFFIGKQQQQHLTTLFWPFLTLFGLPDWSERSISNVGQEELGWSGCHWISGLGIIADSPHSWFRMIFFCWKHFRPQWPQGALASLGFDATPETAAAVFTASPSVLFSGFVHILQLQQLLCSFCTLHAGLWFERRRPGILLGIYQGSSQFAGPALWVFCVAAFLKPIQQLMRFLQGCLDHCMSSEPWT